MLSMTNASRRKTIPAIAVVAALAVAVSVALAGCTESARVSYNIKQDADNFNVARRLTVFNMRSDKVLMQMTGCFALHNDSDNELEVVCDAEQMVVVVNFSGEAWEDYQVPLTKGGKWTEVLTTDDKKYGGSDIHNGTFKAVKGEYHSRDWSAKITVPALGAVFLKPEL